MNNNNLESGGGVEASAGVITSRRDTTSLRGNLERQGPPHNQRTAGVATGPLDSFISFNQRYVLRLMVWTFLLGFAWATITWLARVTHGQTHTNINTNLFAIAPEERNIQLSWDRKWTIDMVGTNGRGVYFTTLDWNQAKMGTEAHMMSNTVFESDWEPTVVKTNGRWRITFKP